MLLFVIFANMIVVQYGRGAIRSALEQGVREGSLDGDPLSCQGRVEEVLDQLLGGRMSEGIEASCRSSGATITASATVIFDAWAPLYPDFVIEMRSEAIIELPP